MDETFDDSLENFRVDFKEVGGNAPLEAQAFQRQEQPGGETMTLERKREEVIPKTGSITKEEFDSHAQLKKEYGINTFDGTPIAGTNQRVDFAYKKGAVEIRMAISPDIAQQLTEEQRQRLHIGQDGGTATYMQEPEPPQGSVDKIEEKVAQLQADGLQQPHARYGPPPTYFINGEEPRMIQANAENVHRLTAKELAHTIQDTPGEGLIFYTGAGISRGGEKPIWGMGEFGQEMHMDNGTEAFVTTLANNPQELTQKFRDFTHLFYEDASTPAHVAIADIVKTKPGSVVFTENFDMKHEADGSRIDPIHFGSLQSHLDLQTRAKTAKTLVTVGLSHDDRAAIAVLKKENPDLKIIAFSLPAEQAPFPNFIKENDPDEAVILGDCQVLLPQIAQQVQTHEQPSSQSISSAV